MKMCKGCRELLKEDEFAKSGVYYRVMTGDEMQRYRPVCRKCHSNRVTSDRKKRKKNGADS